MESQKTRSEDQPRFINPWKRYVGCFVPNWLLRRTEISRGSKLCYGRLAQYAGRKGVAYPRQDTLAEELGCTERQIRRYIAQLCEYGLIHVEDRRNKKIQNKYKFLDHQWQYEGEVIDDDEPDSQPPEDPPARGGSGVAHRTETSSGVHRTGMSCEPTPSQDIPVLTRQDKNVLSRRESPTRESPPYEETHSAGRATRAGSESAKKHPMATPKVFATALPLGSEQDEGGPGEDQEEEGAKPAARPKTRKPVKVRMSELEKTAAEAAEKANAQQKQNQTKKVRANHRKEQNVRNLKSEGPCGPDIDALERVWIESMAKVMPELTIAWDAKQRGQAQHLLERYGVQISSDALCYVVENWSEIGPRYFKKPGVPTIGLVLRLHDSLVIEAQKWSQHRETISEWEEWAEKNPYSLDPPGDLQKRYRKAKEELAALGIGGP